MAEKKNTSSKNDKRKSAEFVEEEIDKKSKPQKEKVPSDPSSVGNQIKTIVLFAVALFVGICFIWRDSVGIIGRFIFEGLFGIFGGSAILVPLLLLNHAIFHKRDVESGAVRYKWSFSVLTVFLLSMTVHSILGLCKKVTPDETVGSLFENGKALVGGGAVGGVCANFLSKGIGYIGVLIFSLVFFIILSIFLFGFTPAMFWERAKFYAVRKMERREENKGRKKEAKKVSEKEAKMPVSRPEDNDENPVATERTPRRRGEIDDDIFYDSDDLFSGNEKDAAPGGKKSKNEDNIYDIYDIDEKPATKKNVRTEIIVPVETMKNDDDDDYGLDSIFNVPESEEAKEKFSRRKDDYYDPDESEAQAEIKVKKETLTPKRQRPAREPKSAAIELPPAAPEKPDYIFPPIDLLPYKEQTSGDSQSEMTISAQKIVDTLENFNIHTRVVGISRGPAVTRYEIAPEMGTKVSAIINRSDDVSLSLASTVRISGVIPGKSAIGIEVPNKNVSIVYLRSLIDSDEFRNAKSKVTAGLGVDLAGTKVFLDVAKMPHLLIAGATGMGKSVCMNSLIVSILYKARPDEVKFIFIDPKKVEFSMYNGIPHLLVPVVFDPKKAAGALHWAVTEMERRYDILEATGKRNLAQYNEATKDDPSAERLPQIIIIIDELADLMTTAPDDVETSINRIAAKARAAGMHLIIGTQRPSVDVITGTIKSNIPSRIACKVSSQIDSRTILDTAGAEKLIGRGDMLFSPVGSMSPTRVQGAFVDEAEIEKIVSFIKEHSEEKEYDSKIVDTINKEAELCGKKGKAQSSAGDDGEGGDEPEDNMLKAAIELAIDEKKISTSLIQRRLSLGYGRAAKLIDVMERRGIVSAPDGQKPRSVLITREQYYEMQMRDSGKTHNNDEEDEAPWED